MDRRLIIFDLDETLVHATDQCLAYPCDFEIPPYFVYLRPHAGDLIKFSAERFDLAVWSSSSRMYVAAVVDRIFSGIPLKFAWSIDRCVQRINPKTNGYFFFAAVSRKLL
jgi:RNA polymerase II subunit A small phosphatase-like protein